MPKIKLAEYSEDYKQIHREGKEHGDNRFCAVAAVAIITGKPYKEIATLMEEKGRKHRQGTQQYITDNVLKDLGYELKRVAIRDIIASFPKPHCNVLKNMTTHHPRRFPGCIDPTKMYLAHVSGHILAITGGQVRDWSVNRSLRIYKLEEVVPAQPVTKQELAQAAAKRMV